MKYGFCFQLCMTLCVAVLASFSAFAQSSGDVRIGKQTWMSKNLDVSTFRNGKAIPEAKNAKQWHKAGKNKKAAFCYYNYDHKNGEKYGKLYNWFAVNDPRGIAPKGYHVPSDAEWTVLTDFLGGEDLAGQKMKSTTGWYNSGNGENSSGFNGLPSGGCNSLGNHYFSENGFFWSSSESSTSNAVSRLLYDKGTRVNRNNKDKSNGLSVRCIKD
jgi:uncharacterized protein (TIGR02145 family)